LRALRLCGEFIILNRKSIIGNQILEKSFIPTADHHKKKGKPSPWLIQKAADICNCSINVLSL